MIALLLIFVGIGFAFPSVSVETASKTTRSPYVAFSVLTNSGLIGEWMRDFVDIETTLDRNTPVGNTSVLTMTIGKDTLELRQEVTHWQPGEQFGVVYDSDLFNGSLLAQLIPVEGGTEVFVQSRFEGTTWYLRSALPLMVRGLTSTQQADYDRMAALTDSIDTPIEGQWAGEDVNGDAQLFRFDSNGRLDWEAAAGDERFQLTGLSWYLSRSVKPHHLDVSGFRDGFLAGKALYGIAEFASDDSLRIDFEAGEPGQIEVRPSTFSESSIVLRRVR